MAELLRNAWLGWQNYIDCGKQAALLLAVLLFLCFTGKWKRQGGLVLYTAVMTVCCVVPATAVLLMLYQTRFYDYEWIWSTVPVTAVTAYGISVFLTEYWTDFKGSRLRAVPVTALVLAAIVLSGGLGVRGENPQREERERAYALLEQVSETCAGGELCLWGPREIMEYAREIRGGITLPYGRNMWDISLDAYAYDIYDKDVILLCRWMEQVEEGGQADLEVEYTEEVSQESSNGGMLPEKREITEIITLEESVDNALAMGVNCIVLPGNAEAGAVRRMERTLGVEALQWRDYYIFTFEKVCR